MKKRDKTRGNLGCRHFCIESLESREMLNAIPVLGELSDITVASGTSAYVALNASDTDTSDILTYAAVTNNERVTATLSNENQSLALVISQGETELGTITLELFENLSPTTTARIIELVNSGYYNSDEDSSMIFHRVIKDFMVQMGDPTGTGTGGTGFKFDDEFNSILQFTQPGVLAMANSGDDTNDSQFFITTSATRWLDYDYNIYGYITSGKDVLDVMNTVETQTVTYQLNGTTYKQENKPVVDVKVESASIFTDIRNGALIINAPEGFTGEVDVTVTVSDGNGGTSEKTFKVTVVPDTNSNANSNPYMEKIDPITVTQNSSVSGSIPYHDVEGDAVIFGSTDGLYVYPENSDLKVVMNESSGEYTLTATNNYAGVASLYLGISNSSTSHWDTQMVPVFVIPATLETPTLNGSEDGSTNQTKNLTFTVEDVLVGSTLVLYVDGTAVSSKTISVSDNTGKTTVTTEISTPSTLSLQDGTHVIKVQQILQNRAVDVGNLSTSVDLSSDLSAGLTVTVSSQSPVFTSAVPTADIIINEPFIYDVQTDYETSGTAVFYSLKDAPEGMIINASTGEVSWTPSAVGFFPVTIQAANSAGVTATQEFELHVVAETSSAAPVLEKMEAQRISEGQLLTYPITATDADGDTLIFSLQGTIPDGAVINPETGVFSWTPGEEHGGNSYTFTVRVVDSSGAYTSGSFQVYVDEVDSPPDFTKSHNIVSRQGDAVWSQVVAVDPDTDRTIRYSLVGTIPEGMQIHPSTGVITWVTPDDYPDGVFTVKVKATEQNTSGYDVTSTEKEITVSVGNYRSVLGSKIVPSAPVGVELLETSDAGLSSTDGITYLNNSSSSNVLRIRVSGVTPGAYVVLYMDETPIGYGVAAYSQLIITTDGVTTLPDGVHSIYARQIISSSSVTWNGLSGITDVPSSSSNALEIAVDTGIPVITSTPVTHAIRGKAYTYNITTDTASSSIQYTLIQGPAGMLLNASTGVLSWTPTDSAAVSNTVKIQVTDLAGNIALQTFTVTVSSEEGPEFIIPGDQSVYVNELLTFTVSTVASDGVTILNVMGELPQGATFLSETGVFSWIPDSTQVGMREIIFSAENAEGNISYLNVSVTVMEVSAENTPPVLNDLALQEISEGELLEIILHATDLDEGDILTYFLSTDAPSGVSINSSTGLITWSPDETRGGNEYRFTVGVKDSSGAEDTTTVTVRVKEVDQPPIFNSVNIPAFYRGKTGAFSISASDPDQLSDGTKNDIQYSIISSIPTGANIDSQLGVFTWSVPDNYATSTLVITFRATEITSGGSAGLSTDYTCTISVENAPTSPVDPSIPLTRPEVSAFQKTLGDRAAVVHTVDYLFQGYSGVLLSVLQGRAIYTPLPVSIGYFGAELGTNSSASAEETSGDISQQNNTDEMENTTALKKIRRTFKLKK